MKEKGEFDPRRIDRIEARLDDFQTRLESLERKLQPATSVAVTAPPPVQTATATPSTVPLAKQLMAARPPQFDFQRATPPPDSPKEKIDAEAQFGSVVLPRVGAAVVLLGIAYLVGLGIANGWITILYQFWGAIALCVASIGVGLWKRSTGFDFGQVLVGLGSCGLYLTFAGGHSYLELYGGEALIAQFLILSIANLIYGAWSPSKTFVGIGLLGGLFASFMPFLQPTALVVPICLQLAIVIPAAIIAGARKWPGMALATWTLSTLAVLPLALTVEAEWPYVIVAIYAAATATLAAYSFANDGWPFDRRAAIPIVGAFVAGGLAFISTELNSPGITWHELVFGAILLAVGFLVKKEGNRQSLWIGGLVAPFVFAPLGLEPLLDGWVYLGLAAAASLLSLKLRPEAMFGFAVSAIAFAAIRYSAQLVEPTSLGFVEETLFLSASIAAVLVTAITGQRWIKNAQSVSVTAMAFSAPAFARLMVLIFGLPQIQATPTVAVIVAALSFAMAGAAVASARKWPSMGALAWCSLFAGLLPYLASLEFDRLGNEIEFPILVAAAGAIVLASRSIAVCGGDRQLAGMAAALTLFPIVSRLAYIGLTAPNIGMSGSAAITLAWTVYAGLLLMAGFWAGNRPVRIFGLLVFGLTLVKVLVNDLAALDSGIRVALLILLGMAMIAGGYWYVRQSGPTGKPPAVAA